MDFTSEYLKPFSDLVTEESHAITQFVFHAKASGKGTYIINIWIDVEFINNISSKNQCIWGGGGSANKTKRSN